MREMVFVACLLAACVPPSAPASDAKAAKDAPSELSEAAALDGRAWVAVDGVGLHVIDDRGWRLLLETRAPIRAMLRIERRLFIVSAFGVQRVDERGQAETIAEIDRNTYSRIGEPVALESEDGRTFQVDGSLGAARYIGGEWEFLPDSPAKPEALQLPGEIDVSDAWVAQPLRSVAIDAVGRVWAGTHNGLILIDADGQLAEYPISQLSEIAGPVGPILVEGNGPPPPTPGRVRTGGLTGVIVTLARDETSGADETRPLPNVKLELCSRLPPGGDRPPNPERSPCEGAEETHTTTTNAEGQFEFSNLPIDHYWFGVEIDGRWARGQPKALNMRAGMSGNVGKVTVAIPE